MSATAAPTVERRSPVRLQLPRRGAMRVPGEVFVSEQLRPPDDALHQVANVATLPGIVGASYAMPDVHPGYGFPIGAVAATDVAAGGVISPGGVGFDISCGVRLLAAEVTSAELGDRLPALLDALAARVPCGTGPGALLEVDDAELTRILTGGAVHLVARGQGVPADLDRCEDGGAVADADPDQVSGRARGRGRRQLGSLGGGNHFLEVQTVAEVLDPEVATGFGLARGQLCVMLHTGSRGLGHQVCTDHVAQMGPAMAAADIVVPDPQLACAPVRSPAGQRYLGAMAAAANYGRANRQVLTEAARDALHDVLAGHGPRRGDAGLRLVYDVSHNLAKLEDHEVAGQPRQLCVQRKGATRALPPGHPDLPAELVAYGQPALVPGSMGTSSYVLVGLADGPAFHSTAHGAGRARSRHAARRALSPGQVHADLAALGVVVRARSDRDLPEEAPGAYKDIDEVVRVSRLAGLARPVVRLRPLGVVKG